VRALGHLRRARVIAFHESRMHERAGDACEERTTAPGL
jgi:hypothetical protein